MNKSVWKNKRLWQEIKPLLNSNIDFVVYDIETTGFSKTDRIIELAAIKYRVDETYTMHEIARYHQYLNPGMALPEKIVELTGITDEMLADKPGEEGCINDIVEFFDGCIIGGHNVTRFDNRFMAAMYQRFDCEFQYAGIIDSFPMAKNLLDKDEVGDYKLADLGAYFHIDFTAHSAIEDVQATAKLIQILIKEYAEAENNNSTTMTGTLHPQIQRIDFWEGYKGFSRIYVNTDMGSVYYDIRNYCWCGKDIDVDTVDMDWLTQQAFALTKTNNETEFARIKTSFFA